MAPGAVCALALSLALAATGTSAQPSCESATDVCACSARGTRCGWCSHSGTCKEAPRCTTTCRECPFAHNNKTSCPECGRVCINTCPAAKTVCACAELIGCGWCNTTQRCTVYPECTTTCEVRPAAAPALASTATSAALPRTRAAAQPAPLCRGLHALRRLCRVGRAHSRLPPSALTVLSNARRALVRALIRARP